MTIGWRDPHTYNKSWRGPEGYDPNCRVICWQPLPSPPEVWTQEDLDAIEARVQELRELLIGPEEENA